MKICFVYPNEIKLPKYFDTAINISTDIDETLPPLGILYIISNSKYDIDFIDNRIEKYSFEKLLDKLMEYDVIGFGGTIFEIKEARRLSHTLMKNGKITIYGGPNATVNWNLYLGYFSIILRGEGEQIFDKLIRSINNPEKIGFSNIGGTYVNKNIFRINDIDQLKFPDRSKIDLTKYRRKEYKYFGDISPIDTIASSRGCPFNCYFCSSKVIWSQKYTYRSADNVIEEMKYMIKKYHSCGFYFREDNFTINKKRLIEFCHKVKGLNIVWMCESRADALDKETIKLMAESGCKGIWFGIESTDNDVLKKIRKNITLEQAKKTVSLCNKHNIATGGAFMLGFPFDTKKSIIDNYQKSKKMCLKFRLYNRVWTIPHSEMYDEIINKGLDYYSYENIILPSTEFLSAREVNKIYFKLVSRKSLIRKKIFNFIGKRRLALIRELFPSIYRLAVKWFH